MAESTDDQLMTAIKRRDTVAFETLFRRHRQMIYSYVLRFCGNRELAQELLQETFTRIWFGAHLYQGQGKTKNWLFTIARNVTRNEMTRKRYSYRHEEIAADDLRHSQQNHSPEMDIQAVDLRDHLAKALKSLDPDLREVMILKHLQQLTFREIAEMTEIRESTLKSRYRKALTELKPILANLEF